MKDFKTEGLYLSNNNNDYNQRIMDSFKKSRLRQAFQQNKSLSQKKKEQKIYTEQRQRRQSSLINIQIAKHLQFDKIQKRQRKYLLQESLKVEYDRQIQRKQYEKAKQKHEEEQYIKISKQHSQFCQKRRIMELARLYKRPLNYQLSLISPQAQLRIKTQPNQYQITKNLIPNKSSQKNRNFVQNPQVKLLEKDIEINIQKYPRQQIKKDTSLNIQKYLRQQKKKLSINNVTNLQIKSEQKKNEEKQVIYQYKDQLTSLKQIYKQQQQQYKKELDHQLKHKFRIPHKYYPL